MKCSVFSKFSSRCSIPSPVISSTQPQCTATIGQKQSKSHLPYRREQDHYCSSLKTLLRMVCIAISVEQSFDDWIVDRGAAFYIVPFLFHFCSILISFPFPLRFIFVLCLFHFLPLLFCCRSIPFCCQYA